MSRSRKRVHELQQICQLRALSVTLAETKCAVAARDVADAELLKSQSEENLALAVSGWEQSLTNSTFDPGNASFWGHAINQGVLGVTSARENVAQSRMSLQHADDEATRKAAEQECADLLFSKTWKKHASAIDEKNIAEIADHFTRMAVRL
jgi:hypothetical protein